MVKPVDKDNSRTGKLPRSFWFIAICGFVTGGFVALGERGNELAQANAQARVAQQGTASAKSTWKAPPPVSSRVAAVGTQVPVAAPTTGAGLRQTPTVAAKERSGPTSNKSAVLVLLIGVLGAGALLVAKKKGGVFGDASTKRLAVVETARVGGRFQVALVKAPGRLLVLGASEKGLTLLTELEPDALEDEDSMAGLGGDPFDLALQIAVENEESEVQEEQAPRAARRRPQARRTEPSQPEAPRRRRTRRPVEPPKTVQEQKDQGDRFLDHLVDRLSAATPPGLERVLEPAPIRTGGPLARYRQGNGLG